MLSLSDPRRRKVEDNFGPEGSLALPVDPALFLSSPPQGPFPRVGETDPN